MDERMSKGVDVGWDEIWGSSKGQKDGPGLCSGGVRINEKAEDYKLWRKSASRLDRC